MRQGVALAGFMGVGKSSVGAALAELIGLPFVDLDALVQAQSGRRVSDIFSCEGEAGFRARESSALADVIAGPPSVVALGGGTIHQEGNLQLLRERYFVVSLLAPLDEIRGRIGPEDETRPLWADAESRFDSRADGYLAADACVDVTGLSIECAASAVSEVLPCR